MPIPYVPKNDPLTLPRVKKMMKDQVDRSIKLEKKYEEAYDYFKTIVDEVKDTSSDTSKKCMLDALKLLKEARNTNLKIFELCVKLHLAGEVPKGKGKKGDVGKTLDDILGDDD